MADPKYKTKVYEEENVDARVRRLAFCFNLAADSGTSSVDLILKKGAEIFKTTTTGSVAPLNEDEQAYMRLQFMKIAAKLQGGRSPGWASYEEALIDKADQFMAGVSKLGVIQVRRERP
jgi:hypothetical protein